MTDREHDGLVAARRMRVDRLALPASERCTRCGGVTEAGRAVEESLRCDCAAWLGSLAERLERRARANQGRAAVAQANADPE